MKAPRRAAVWAAAAATAVLLLVLVLRPSTPSPTHDAGPPRRPAAAEPDARRPGDPAPTEEGARAAAVAVATASQDWLYLSDAAMGDAVRSVATADAGPALAAETVAELGRARDGLARSPGRVWWVVRPLASHVEFYDPPRARVVVWTVSVLSAAEVALPQADWSRAAVDLVWEAGRWRASAVTDTPGPTPAVGGKDRPWQAVAFDDALDGFERVGATGGRP